VSFLRPVFLASGAVLHEHCQAFAVEVQVRQGEAGATAGGDSWGAPVSHLVEAEDALQDAERMLHLRS
jgi:hypothetical protein